MAAIVDDGWDTPVGETSKRLFMVLFGAPNVGKTILANRISGKTLILTDESGHIALKGFPDLEAKARVRVIKHINDIEMAIKRRAAGKSDFDTLILDTFTGIQFKLMQYYMDPAQSGEEFMDFTRKHKNLLVQQDYLFSRNLWYPVISKLAEQTEFDVILNCHVQLPDAEKNLPGDLVRPALPNAIYQLVNGKANVVAYMGTMGGDEMPSQVVGTGKRTPVSRFISVARTNKVAGKNQIHGLPPAMPDDVFVEKVNEWRNS